MKKFILKLIRLSYLLLPLITLAPISNAQVNYTLTDDDVVVTEGIITLCSYNFGPNNANGGTNLIIPETLDGQKIIGIIGSSYYNGGVFENKGIKSVKVPSSIQSIGERAFCRNALTILQLNGCIKLTTIGSYAFGRNELTSVYLNDCSALKEIKSYSFYTNNLSDINLVNCRSLCSIEAYSFSQNNIVSLLLPSVTFENDEITEWTDGTNTYRSGVNQITDFGKAYSINAWYTLKDDDVIVTDGTIDSCSYNFLLKNIIIPKTLDGQSVYRIADALNNDGVFENRGIISLNLPISITNIGKRAFANNKITSLDLSACSALAKIADYSFCYNNIGDINFANCSSLISIGERAFYSNGIANLDLSRCTSLTSIEYAAFYSNIVSTVNFANCSSLKKIGEWAFESNQINTLDLSECTSLDTIAKGAFYSNNITSVNLSNCSSLILIGERAFYNNEITNLDLSSCKNIESIDYAAFYSNNIITINFDNCASLKTIGEWAFEENETASLDLSSCTSLTSIGKGAFYQNSITTLNLSNCKSLKTIGGWAFYENKIKTFNLTGCSSLESIYRTSFCRNEIESLDFSDCTELTSIASHAFRENNITNLNISNCKKLKSIGFTAFYENELNSIDLSSFEFLISIGTYAFANNNFYNFNLPDKTTFNSKPYSKWLSGNGYSYYSGNKVSNLNVCYYADVDSVYTLTDDDVTVSSSGTLSDVTYNFELKNIIIPNVLDGYQITSISNNAFRQVDLVSIKLPDSLKIINYEAFFSNNLKGIDFTVCPNLEKLYYSAFQYNQIASVNLNDNTALKFIGKDVFSNTNCSNFKLPTPKGTGFVEWFDNYNSTYNGGQTVYNLTREYTAKFNKYDVTFIVKDENNNFLDNAIVKLDGYDIQSTDSEGKTIFTDVNVANNISYNVSKVGYFSINGTLNVVDNTVSRTINLVTGFTADNTVACDSMKVNFIPGSRDNYSAYIWDFGDGTKSTQMTPQHAYNQTGLYTVSLVVQGSEGSLDTITIKDYIKIYPSPGDLEIYPINEYVFSKSSVELSWTPIEDCLGYDIYIWEDILEKPESSTNETQQIRITKNLQYGTSYKWQVVAHSHCKDVESEIQTFRVIGLPDLVLDSLLIPETAYAGQEIDISWHVKNVGNEPTNVPQWDEFVWFSNDADVRLRDDIIIGKCENPSFLDIHENYIQNVKVNIPEGIKAGIYYVFVIADNYDAYSIDFDNHIASSRYGFNKMAESNDQNNFIFKEIEIKIPDSPDLIPQNISHTGETFSNTDIAFSYEVHNEGKAAVIGKNWYDAIYISPNNVFDKDATILQTIRMSQDLPIDSSYKNEVTVHIPHRIYGEYYFYVKTDYGSSNGDLMDGNIYEYYYESNNVQQSTKPINIILGPTPDLVVESINSPSTLITDKNSIDFTIVNQGVGTTVENYWIDAIYLSKDEKIDGTDLKLSTINHTGILNKGATYFNRKDFTIPFSYVGEYYLIVETDYGDKVFEYESEKNNTITKKVDVQLLETPDFIVENISIDNENIKAGDKVRINYIVKNISDEPLTNQTLTDRIFMNSSYIGQNSDVVSLGKNETISRFVDYTIPYTYSGNIRFKINTNYNSGIKERITDNNQNEITTIIASAPKYDLAISSINAENMVSSCEKLNVDWTVVNSGAGKSTISRWTDNVYLSSENKISSKSTLLSSVKRYEALDVNETYTFSKEISIPCGISGKYYICIESNSEYKNNETSSINNFISKSIQIGEIEYADLTILEQKNSKTAYAGQPYNFTFEVRNSGDGKTNVSNWSDAIYLSADREISSNDILLKTIYHSGELIANGSYSINESIEIPNYLAGAYYVIFKTDYKGNVFETDKTNNELDYPLALSFTPIIDIAVTDVNAPDEVEPQGTASVSWSLGNAGGNDIDYTITDGVYWSKDTIWDIQDAMMGFITHKVNIAVGTDTEEVTMTDEIPAMTPGDYHVIVRANQRKSVYESDYENNKKYATNNTSVFIEDLSEGELKTTNLKKGERKYYCFNSPSDETVEIVLKSSNNQSFNELYIGFESIPDKSTYDLIYPSQGNNQRIVIPTTKQGKYYILVVAENTNTEEELTIQANILHFEINSVTVNNAGNGGIATVKVEGSKFLPSMDLRLERNNDFIAADHLVYKDMSVVIASFNLSDKEIGTYNVVAELASGEYAKLENGFTIVPAEPEELQTYINAPASVRPERKFTFLINYWNAGNNDMNIEGFKVESTQGAPIAFSFEELDSAYTELYIPVREEGNEPGVLRPDYIGKKEVYCYSTNPISLVLYAIKKQRK